MPYSTDDKVDNPVSLYAGNLYWHLSVMNEQQIRLDTAVHGINSNGIERQRELNKGYLQELKAFLTDLNTLNRKNSHSDFIWKLR